MPGFPNLFIIGAMKAGTSSLHEYLHQHPQIFMSRFKEPQYFAPHLTRWSQAWGQGNPFPAPGIEWYLKLFEDSGEVRYAGESSVSYTARPVIENCARRIYEFNQNARLIYVMRDPIERAISHYWYFVKDGREDRDILTALKRRADYISRSNYAYQLQPYFDYFGRDRVFTLTLEELSEDPDTLFKKLFSWLDVDLDAPIRSSQKFNVGSRQLKQTRRGLVYFDTMMKHWRWKRLEPQLPGFIPKLLRQGMYRTISKSATDVRPAISYLRPILLQHTERLKHILCRDFPEWTTLNQCDGCEGHTVSVTST